MTDDTGIAGRSVIHFKDSSTNSRPTLFYFQSSKIKRDRLHSISTDYGKLLLSSILTSFPNVNEIIKHVYYVYYCV